MAQYEWFYWLFYGFLKKRFCFVFCESRDRPKPDNESLIGRVVVIRKAAGNLGTLLTVTGSNGVTITPADISPLRRVGSEISLVYVGYGVWAATGELP